MPTGYTQPAACAGSCLTRRGMLLGSIAASASATLGSAAPAAASGNKSGKPWASGVALINPMQLDEFNRFRGRPVDTVTVFMRRRTWADIVTLGERSRWLSYTGADRPECLVQSFGWLPMEPRGFAPFYEPTKTSYTERWNVLADALGRGGSDDCEPYWVQAANSITRAARIAGYRSLIVRIGWEFTSHDYPWSAYEVQYAPAFRKMWARCATILKDNANGVEVLTQWDPLRRGRIDASVDNWYPNEDPDTVDIIGVDYYEGAPVYDSQADWDAQFYRTHLGGPWGLGAWLEYTRDKGKRFGIAEWGIHLESRDGLTYIRNMHDTFERYSSLMAYENLFEIFNSDKKERKLSLTKRFAAARAAYLERWGA